MYMFILHHPAVFLRFLSYNLTEKQQQNNVQGFHYVYGYGLKAVVFKRTNTAFLYRSFV